MEIIIDHVSKQFSHQSVIQDISFSIPNGEIFGLIGPSGSGKTTLIRLICGAISADSGSIRLGGHIMPNLNALEKIGYMPQNDALYLDLSGLENLEFFAKMQKLIPSLRKERIKHVLSLVELEGEKKKLVQNYSGGMKKRLSLAISLLTRPDVLFLDEPTVGIDPILRKKIWDQLELQRKQGMTILVTTHVMDEARKCDRLALIYHGKLLASNTTQNLLSQTKNGNIEELFLSSTEVSL